MCKDDIKLFSKNEKELETQIHAVRIYSQNIEMEFGIEKCAMVIMKSGKHHMTDGMELPNQEKIRTLGGPSRRFLCLFWRETRQGIFGSEISPYPEVVRGHERELEKEAERVGDGTAERRVSRRVGVEPRTGAVNTGLRRQ